MIRLRDFIRVGDCYFSVVGYEHSDGVKCLLRYVPDERGDRRDIFGRKYRKLDHEEALGYDRFRNFHRDGIFLIPNSKIDEIYRPDEKLEEIRVRDEIVDRIADFFDLPKMGVTGSRLIGLNKPNSDVDFVAYGRRNFKLGRRRIKEGIEEGELAPPDLVRVYRKRRNPLPFEVFRVHEERKFNKAVLNGIHLDLLFVRDDELAPVPERKGNRMGTSNITAIVTDSRYAFDYPACYFVDHSIVEAVLSFTHSFVGQVFEGEVLEARGVLEEIDNKIYLIVGTRRDPKEEYIVSRTLLKLFDLEYVFDQWKAKTFKCTSKSSLENLGGGAGDGGTPVGR